MLPRILNGRESGINIEIIKNATFLLSNNRLSFKDIKEGMYVYLAAGKENFDKFIGSMPNDVQFILRILME